MIYLNKLIIKSLLEENHEPKSLNVYWKTIKHNYAALIETLHWSEKFPSVCENFPPCFEKTEL